MTETHDYLQRMTDTALAIRLRRLEYLAGTAETTGQFIAMQARIDETRAVLESRQVAS